MTTEQTSKEMLALADRMASASECSSYDGRYNLGYASADERDMIVSALRLAAQPSAVAVKVKPLEWQKSHVLPWQDDWHTTGPFTYTIRCADENGWKWSSGYGYGWCSTPDAAKAAAQADYEARIKSALAMGDSQ